MLKVLQWVCAVIRRRFPVGASPTCVVAPLLTYTSLAVSATLLAWLLWFGN
jgi:hypothetical protein